VRALVTGAGGFIGAHLCGRLADDGWEVTGTVRPGSGAPAAPADSRISLDPVDLADPSAPGELARRTDPHIVFLLGASRAENTPAERAATVAVNTTSGSRLVEALGPQCRAVVRMGSSTEYAQNDGPMDETTPVRPGGFFGATKAAGSLLDTSTAAVRGIRAVVLRAFQVYGPGDHPGRLVPTALRAARTGEVLSLTEPGMRRDWVHVDDVVEACVRAALADHLPAGQVLNIGTGRQVANEQVVAAIERVTAQPVRVAVGAHAGRSWDTSSWVCDASLARDLLGWAPQVTLDAGLARCWEAGHR